MPPLRSVRAYLAWLVLACLLPGIIGAVFLFVHEYREGRAQLEKDTILTARTLAQAVDSQILKARAVGEALATDESLARGDFDLFRRRAQAALQRTEVGDTVALLDGEARQVFNLLQKPRHPLPLSVVPETVRQVFATGEPAVSDLFPAPIAKVPVVSVFVPVTIDGHVAYVLGIGIRAEHLTPVLQRLGLPPDWLAAVFDRTGTIVARTHAPERFVGQKGTQEYIEHILQNREGAIETVSREGVPILSIFSRSAATGWTVGIGIPREALEANLNRTLAALALAVAALFCIGLSLAWLLGGRIARSVRAVTSPAADGQRRFYIQEAAEAAGLLHERQAGLRAIFEQAAVGIARVALDGRWLEVNDRLCAIVGYGREEMAALSFQEITHPDDLAGDLELAGKLLAGAVTNYTQEKRYIRKDGCTVWVDLTASLVRKPNGEPDYFIAVVVNIQRRKHAEAALDKERQTHLQKLEQEVAERTAALREAHRFLEQRVAERTEEVRRLAAEVTYAEERERQALARDLHDDLGQLLHVIRLRLGLLAKRNLPAEERTLVEDTASLVSDASHQVRSLTSQLSPPVLATLGLPAAIHWLAGEIQQTYGLAVHCRADDLGDCLSLAQSAILFRAARELLINAAKHSGSSEAAIQLQRQEGVVTLTVTDSGVGFRSIDEALAGTKGFGLASIRERLAFLGGSMAIQAATAGGAQVTLNLPIRAETTTDEVSQ